MPRLAHLALAVLALLASCTRPSTVGMSFTAFRSAAGGVDWELRDLNGAPAPAGVGGRRATLRFDADSARAGGSAGCNRWFGGYTIDGPGLRFSAVGMTRMACAEGLDLERRLAAALEATRTYRLNASELTLVGGAGPVAWPTP